MFALSWSNDSAHRPARRWSLVITALLLTLLAHLLLLQWLNNLLQSIAFFADDEDENSISVSLLRPEAPRSSPARRPTTPVVPKRAEPAPPENPAPDLKPAEN